MDLKSEYEALVARLERDGVRLVRKDRLWHQRAIDRLLRVLTWGGQSAYLDGYVTTIGRTIYVTADWDARALADRWATLRHEVVHLAQFRRWGRVPMALAYLFLPLPFGLAWCRMRVEREAYEETIRVHHELGTLTESLREHVLSQFTSGSYGWMWPFPRAVARWYDNFVATLK